MPELVQGVAPFGFGAIMAVLVFFAYERLVRKVIAVVEANTRAMEQLSSQLSRSLQDLSRRVADLERQRPGG